MILKNVFTWPQWRYRHREYTYGHGERGRKGKIYGESNMETYITICEIDKKITPSPQGGNERMKQ